MNKLKRFLKHLLAGRWQVEKFFPSASMRIIESAIQQSETTHMGELRFAVEAGLDWHELWYGITPRQRAIEVFSQLRVWDTQDNSGVLIYLLLADRCVEIVADRGIHVRVGDGQWADICREMERAFLAGDFNQGVMTGIHRISGLLADHFPATTSKTNELSNTPVVL